MKFQSSLSLAILLSFVFQTAAYSQSRPINKFRAQATSSLPSFRYDDYDLEKYQSLKRDADRRLTDAQRNFESINRDYNQAVEKENRINQNLQQQSRQLEIAKRDESRLQNEISQNQQQIAQLERKIPQIKSEQDSLQSQVNSTNQVIADLNSKLSQATTDEEKQRISRQIESQTQVLNNLNSQLTAKGRELSQSESELAKSRSDLTSNGRSLESKRRESQNLESSISDLQRQTESARRETRERERARDISRDEVQSRSREVEVAERNYNQVARNIEIAKQVLEDQAIEQGSMDGQLEGSELGASRGSRDGQNEGTQRGREQGITDGRKRDYNTGYAAGESKATEDAIAESEKAAQVNGKKDGLARGQTDGLANAYNLGLNEGIKHGEETGSDREAYALGRKEGEAAGLVKAIDDAKPQEPLGYDAKEKEYLSAPLNKVIVGDSNLAKKFEGLQGRFSEEGDDRYYRPQPGVIPHPRLETYYLTAYDRAYRTELSSTYRSVYRREYDSSYSSSYRRNYDENYSKRYADSEKSGYDTGYRDTYQVEYDANYRVRYAVIYKFYYDQNFEKFKLDAAERARGFKDGNRTASKAKGYKEGFQASYAANIEIEKRKAFAAGQARAKNLYDNNAVIQVTSLELKEMDVDGINRPGESLAVVMKLKNFGLKAKSDLQSEILNAQGALSLTQLKMMTGSIPAQSDATVVVPTQSLVTRSAVDGSNLQATLQAVSGSIVHASQRISLSVQYPTLTKLINFDGILIPGVATPVKVRVLNRSKKAQNLNLSILVDNSKVEQSQNQLQAQLQAGEQKELNLILTGKMEARFEESPLEITTTQGSDQFAMFESMKMTIIRKHTPTADSKGLIISSNLALGAGKKLFGVDKLDTWDLRVDGSIDSITKIASYQSKVIHVLADLNSEVDAKTAAVLKDFIAKNGSVIVWGSKLDRSPLGQVIMQSAGVSVLQSQNLNGQVIGIEKLNGLNMNYQGEISVLRTNSLKGSYALNSASGVMGVITSGNGISESTAQVAVIGLDMLSLTDLEVQSVMNRIDVLRSSFENKMRLASNQPNTQMALIVHDLTDEMVSAELLGTGNFYKNNSEKNKIFRVGKRMIGEAGRKSAQAIQLGKSYAQLIKVIETKLNKEKWRAELVLDKRHGSFVNARSIKDLFCENNRNSTYCQSGPNN